MATTPNKASDDQLFTLEPLVAFLVELLLGGRTTGSGQGTASVSVPADAINEIDRNFALGTGPCTFNLGDNPDNVRMTRLVEESAGIQLVVEQIFVRLAMQIVGPALGDV